jgi:rhamnosyltransferase
MSEKTGAVFVTFNPDKEVINNLLQILSQVDYVVIVDNASSPVSLFEIESLQSQNTKIHLIKNDKNLGIATALNQGCNALIGEHCQYAFLLDQDSYVSDGIIISLTNIFDKFESCAIASPNILPKNISENNPNYKSSYMVKSKGIIFSRENLESRPLQVLFNITSGSLVKLDVWKEVGGFWDELFIDGVDNEFGLRVNNFNYQIIIDNKSVLHQEYGELKVKKVLGKCFYPTNHSPNRHYYMTRNRLKVWKRYYRLYPYYIVWDLLAFSNAAFKILCFEQRRVEKFKFILKGIKDGILGKGGGI